MVAFLFNRGEAISIGARVLTPLISDLAAAQKFFSDFQNEFGKIPTLTLVELTQYEKFSCKN